MTGSSDLSTLHASKLFTANGKVVLVTGGGTGIGAMIARTLASNGAKVYIVGRRLDVLEKCVEEFKAENPNASGSLVILKGDVGSKAGIASLKKDFECLESVLDILVNNAGKSGTNASFGSGDISSRADVMWSVSESDALAVYQTNVLGPYFLSAAFLPLLGCSSRHPQIINIGSVASFSRCAPKGVIYPLSKSSVIHLTKIMATELNSTVVRCNCIAPGLFPSEILPTGDQAFLLDHMLSITPAGRLGTEAEMAATIMYLCADHNNFLNGAIIPIDGGVLTAIPSTY
ncbi:hypothetical protein CROQUDRAFT_662990 [Cronartium quercuum f. sp. fusiforme G11]|uniref:NAD(P)-binding protein n=1 Tax=Cronartium quercuum f. sp. fusiforme G11 TaxID=708437 RepID=A0A9P6T7N0_9BASI|nr:hypothetical protein CROQUDRAFT_662990 [Cronartium quercuum f. sp. fusiforme G11]